MGGREREIVRRTRELLKSAGAKAIKTSGEGEPDIVGVYRGIAFAIECKQVGKKPTPVQEFRIKEWKKAGAVAMWTDFPAQALVDLEAAVMKRRKEYVDPIDLAERFHKHFNAGYGQSPYKKIVDHGNDSFDIVQFFADYRDGKRQ